MILSVCVNAMYVMCVLMYVGLCIYIIVFGPLKIYIRNMSLPAYGAAFHMLVKS
jgi:hypothetical protein